MTTRNSMTPQVYNRLTQMRGVNVGQPIQQQPTEAQNDQSLDITQRINEILGYGLQGASGMSAGLTSMLNRGADPVLRQNINQQYRSRLGNIGSNSQGSSADAQRSVAGAQQAAQLGQARADSQTTAMNQWGGFTQALQGLAGSIPQLDYAPGTTNNQALDLNRILGIQSSQSYQ